MSARVLMPVLPSHGFCISLGEAKANSRRILYQFFEVNVLNSLSVPPCISTASKEFENRMHKAVAIVNG